LIWIVDQLAAPWQSELAARGGLVALLVGAPAAAIGCWVLLRDLPYAAESLAHGMFPGLVAAALIGIPPAIGGLVGLIVAALLIIGAGRIGLAGDTAVAVAITPLLGLGALIALAGTVPPGLSGILFGDVLAANSSDVLLAALLAVVTLITLRLTHWRLLASGLGRAGSSDFLILLLLALATVAAARALGALLAVALIIGPPVAARTLCSRATPMIIVAAVIAAIAAFTGIELSWHAGIAAGPAIALCAILPAALVSIPMPSWSHRGAS